MWEQTLIFASIRCRNGQRGLKRYKYTSDLLEMDGCKSGVSLSEISSELQRVHTPVKVDVWEEYLRTHARRQRVL